MGIKNIIGNLGLLPRLAMDAYDKEHDKAEAAEKESAMYKDAFMNMGNRETGMKKGGKVKVSSASKRADGIAQRGKTRGRIV